MRRSITIATTTAAVLAGGLVVITPAAAAGFGGGSGMRNGMGVQASSSRTTGMGQGMGQGMGRRGPGAGTTAATAQRGSMHSTNLANVGSGTLTDAQKARLAYMAEEEKLAHDVYTRLAEKYPTERVFSRISDSEQQHLDSVRTLLVRYDVADPTAGKGIGQFASADISSLYSDLLASAATIVGAYQAGVAIEEDDIAELAKADDGVTAPDVNLVYDNLTTASERHLAAFQRHL